MITGADRRLGFAMAQGLCATEDKVHYLDLPPEPAKAFIKGQLSAKEEFGGELVYHQTDVTHNEQLEKCVEELLLNKNDLMD